MSRNPAQLMAAIESADKKLREIEQQKKLDTKELIDMLSVDLGVEVGDKVQLYYHEEIGFVHKLFLNRSREWRYLASFENKTDNEIKAAGVLPYALWAECFTAKNDGSLSRKKSPEYNTHSLEKCIVLQE